MGNEYLDGNEFIDGWLVLEERKGRWMDGRMSGILSMSD